VPDPSSPLSWRDVYRAVGDSKTDIIAALNAAVEPLVRQTADHEERLRTIEATVVPLQERRSDDRERLASVEALAHANDKAIDRFINRESGVFSTLGAGKTAALFFVAFMGPILSVIALVAK